MNRTTFLLTILIGYALFFVLRFPFPYFFPVFFLGLVIGYFFHVIDRVVQVLFVPEFSSHKKHFFQELKTGKVFSAFSYLVKDVPSMTTTFYFLLLYFPLASYLITSSGSVLGIGLMLGLGLSYSVHFILHYKNVSNARELYFKPLTKQVRDQDIKRLMSGFILLFVILSFLVIF